MVKWPPSVPQYEWDYLGDTDPTTKTTVKKGETWYDTANNEGKSYNGTSWDLETVGDYTELGGTIPQDDIANDTIIARMVAADAITNTQVADNAIDTAEIVADAVTNALVAADAVDTEQVAADAVTNGEIAGAAVDTTQVAQDAITTALIATGAVTNTEMADNAIDTAEIVTDAVTTALIATDAVTATEIANNAVSESHLSFATATQTELDSHEGDTGNPHNVTDDQTGAASALSNHASNSTAHHSKPTSVGGNNSNESSSFGAQYTNYSGTAELHSVRVSFEPDDYEGQVWATVDGTKVAETGVKTIGNATYEQPQKMWDTVTFAVPPGSDYSIDHNFDGEYQSATINSHTITELTVT